MPMKRVDWRSLSQQRQQFQMLHNQKLLAAKQAASIPMQPVASRSLVFYSPSGGTRVMPRLESED
jgi:hypothetical protein